MRSFAERAWSPTGSRPHIVVVLSELAAMQNAYRTQVADWWATTHPADPRLVSAVFPPVPAQYLHLTLAWLDRLSSEVDLAQWDQLTTTLADQLRSVEPVTARVGPAMPTTCAIEAWVDPDPRLAELARAARAALRAVFGDDAAPDPVRPWRPHAALCYAMATVDTETLAAALVRTESPPGHLIRPQPITVTEVSVVDNDTFPAEGGTLRWNLDTVRTLPLTTPRP